MTKRYDTLDVSINAENSPNIKSSPKRLSNTIDFGESVQTASLGQNDQRVNKFRDLYYKNEKLRRELKLLNLKLNEKLQKVKLMPSKKKKAMSVDLNVQKPSKALQRELQNAYSQIAMYKKQVASLKIKEESTSLYQKYKTLENEISYKDIELSQVQAQLKSIKSIKKMQQRTLVEDLQNQDLIQRKNQLQRQFKQGQQKLKQIAKKARKRQQQYKKQQAYQVALQKKSRKQNMEQEDEDQMEMSSNSKNRPPPVQLTQNQFKEVRGEIQKFKADNQTLKKKVDIQKKYLRDLRKNMQHQQEKSSEFDVEIKALGLKIESYRRLIRDNEKKKAQNQLLTGYETNNYIGQNNSNSTSLNKKTKFNPNITEKQDSLMKLDEIEMNSQEDEQNGLTFHKHSPFQMSQGLSTIKDQRQWKGKPRKVTFGFMDSRDAIHKFSGNFKGFKIYIDESQNICGLNYVYKENGYDRQSGIIGSKGVKQIKWQLQNNDKVSKISGSLTEQGYLAQLIIQISNNVVSKLGSSSGADNFSLKMDKNEEITGFYCGIRMFGSDVRITQIGFWISKSA